MSLSSKSVIRLNLRSGPILAVLISFHLARRKVIYKAKRKWSLISGYIRLKKNTSVNFHLRPVPHEQLRGICKFCTARGSGICQHRDHPRAFNTHVASHSDITSQRILLRFHWKQADRLIRQGREKIAIVEGWKGMFSILNKYFFNPELHGEISSCRRKSTLFYCCCFSALGQIENDFAISVGRSFHPVLAVEFE